MISNCRAIVLNQIKFKETSLIVHLYTREYGRISVLVNSVFSTSKRKKNKASFFQPLSLLDIIIDYKPSRDIQPVREFSSSFSLSSIHFNIKKSFIAMFVAEMIYKAVREEESNTHLFDFIESSIRYLDISEESFSNFHLVFLIKLSKYLGFFPMFESYKPNYLFNIKKGVFNSYASSDFFILDKELSKNLYEIGLVNYSEMGIVALSGKRRVKLLEIIIEYYFYHIDTLGTINSLEILKEVFEN